MLRSNLHESIPSETVRVAQAALSRNNRYVKLGKQFGAVFSDQTFASLFPARSQPAAAPWRLALVTVLQLAEGLSDRELSAAKRFRRLQKQAICSGTRRVRKQLIDPLLAFCFTGVLALQECTLPKHHP